MPVDLRSQSRKNDTAFGVQFDRGREELDGLRRLIGNRRSQDESNVGEAHGGGTTSVGGRPRRRESRETKKHAAEACRGCLLHGWRPDIRVSNCPPPGTVRLRVGLPEAVVEDIDLAEL